MEEIEQKDAPLQESEAPESVAAPEEPKEEPKEEKREYTTEEKLARVTRLKQRYEKELGIEPAVVKVEPAKEKGNPGELDETQLELLELRGYSEQEDIDLIQNVMRKTGQTLRETLKDEYVASKLASNKKARDVKAATPSASKHGGQASSNSLEYWTAEYDRSGKLPDDFELRQQVIRARAGTDDDRLPPWRK